MRRIYVPFSLLVAFLFLLSHATMEAQGVGIPIFAYYAYNQLYHTFDLVAYDSWGWYDPQGNYFGGGTGYPAGGDFGDPNGLHVYIAKVYVGPIPGNAPPAVQDAYNQFLANVTRYVKLIGYPNPTLGPETTCDKQLGGDLESCQSQPPMMQYSAHGSAGSLRLQDAPLTYKPSFGPPVDVTVFYTDGASSSVGGMAATNGGWRTSFDCWLQDDPNNPANAVTVFPRGGGSESYSTYDGSSTFTGNRWGTSSIVRTSVSPQVYERRFVDGSKEVYGLSDNANTAPRHIYLTEVDDAWGNAVTLQYSSLQLSSITDAAGKVTTFVYSPNNPTQLWKLVDPFGRTAALGYDNQGRLQTTTDPIGTVSTVGYGTDGKAGSLTTPYGTSQFARSQATSGGAVISGQVLQMIDPLGGVDRIETDVVAPQPVFKNGPDGQPYLAPQSFQNPAVVYHPFAADPTDQVDFPPWANWLNILKSYPTNPVLIGPWNGIATRQISAFDTLGASGQTTYFWDKKANMMSLTGYASARQYGWAYGPQGVAGSPAWTKAPLEAATNYLFNGQTAPGTSTDNHVVKSFRIKSDGFSQTEVNGYAYANPLGLLTQSVDPIGRTTTINYDPTNSIDVTSIQNTTNGASDVLSTFGNYKNHQPQAITDAAGEQTSIVYNGRGQPSTITNAKNEVTVFLYDEMQNDAAFGRPVTVTRAFGTAMASTTTYGYDGYGRLQTITDSEGYILTLGYDTIGGNPLASIDRVTSVTFPDGSSRQYLYDDPRWPLDVAHFIDRQGRRTAYQYDALRRRIQVTDPVGNLTQFGYCVCGALDQITDPNGNVTIWQRDLEKRITSKGIAGQTVANYTYDPSTGLLITVTDALNQVTSYGYYNDDRLASITYTGSINPTPNVSFQYDPAYSRLSQMNDGIGATLYSYYPVLAGTLGAGQLETVSVPIYGAVNNWNTVTYNYDELGRVLGRSINGNANSNSVAYDALGRVTGETNLLGSFSYGYVNQTKRLDHITFPNGLQKTQYSWYPNLQDQRLQDISNFNHGGALLSESHYDSIALEGAIKTWTRTLSGQSDPSQYNFGYDNDDQLISAALTDNVTNAALKTYGYAYDPAGNRTTFTEDGVALTETPNAFNQISENAATNGTMLFKGTVSEPANVTLAGIPATMNGLNWEATVPVSSGANGLALQAAETVSPPGATPHRTTGHINFTLDANLGNGLGYDINGNMLNNQGAQTYAWDAANRLISITYTGTSRRTNFAYDGASRLVAIFELANENVVSEKHFTWVGASVAEERDSVNNVTKRFFTHGEQRGSENYYYTRDHLDSIREMVDASGAIRARYDYDPWGAQVKIGGDLDCDFAFIGSYKHAPSALQAATFRFYSPDLSRWLSRDPMQENSGFNLYRYVRNSPLNRIDRHGLAEEDLTAEELEEEVELILRSLTPESPEEEPAYPTLSAVPYPEESLWDRIVETVIVRVTRGGETEATRCGREAHEDFYLKVIANGGRATPRLIGKDGTVCIPDGIMPSNELWELKPDTPSGRRAGAADQEYYQNQLGLPVRLFFYTPKR